MHRDLMKGSWRWLTLLVLVLLLGVQGAGAGSTGGTGFTPAGSGVSVRFTQFNWLADDEGVTAVPSSRAGVVELAFDSSAQSLLTGSGGAYLNLYTSVDGTNYSWEVENLYLQYDTSDDVLNATPGVDIDLGNTEGTTLSSLTFQASLTADPVLDPTAGGPSPSPTPTPTPTPTPAPTPAAKSAASAPTQNADVIAYKTDFTGAPIPGAATYTAPVTLADFHVGGYAGGGSGPAYNPGRFQNPAPRARVWVVRRVSTRIPFNRLPVVSEGWMGCAPGGVARSIRYMLDQRGPGGPNAQNIYSNLYWFMQTNVGAWGTSGVNMINGKANYAAWARMGITTNWVNGLTNMNGVMNVLAAGGDIEINLIWAGGGGHVAMVTSITQMSDGTYQITYVDDPRQGDGIAQNQSHTIIVYPNGSFLGNGTAGWIAGFVAETMP